MNSTKSSTFHMPFGDLITGGSVVAYHAGIASSDFQSFDRGRSIGGMKKIFPVFSQSFAFERLKDWTVYIDRKMMMAPKVTTNSLPWKAIAAGQANEGAIFGFMTKQRAILQKRIGVGRVHVVRRCLSKWEKKPRKSARRSKCERANTEIEDTIQKK